MFIISWEVHVGDCPIKSLSSRRDYIYNNTRIIIIISRPLPDKSPNSTQHILPSSTASTAPSHVAASLSRITATASCCSSVHSTNDSTTMYMYTHCHNDLILYWAPPIYTWTTHRRHTHTHIHTLRSMIHSYSPTLSHVFQARLYCYRAEYSHISAIQCHTSCKNKHK